MKNSSDPLLSFSIAILFILLSLYSFAQPRGMTMGQVYGQVNQTMMNQQMNLMMMQQMNNANWMQYAGKGRKYFVTYKDSTTVEVESFMNYDKARQKYFLVYVDKNFPKKDSVHRYKKIYPDQTLKLADSEDEDAKYGLPTDTGWTFKVITGAVTVYAKNVDFLVTTKMPMFGAPVFEFAPVMIIGIQFSNGPVEKLSKENVSKMIARDAKATALLNKKGMYEAIKLFNEDVEPTAPR